MPINEFSTAGSPVGAPISVAVNLRTSTIPGPTLPNSQTNAASYTQPHVASNRFLSDRCWQFATAGLIVGLLVLSLPYSAQADAQRPSIVNGIVSSADNASNSIVITWNRPWDNVAVNGYNIYRDSNYLTTVFDTRYTDFAAPQGRSVRYQITAFDGSGNYSEMSGVTSATLGSGSVPQAPANSGSNSRNTASVPTNVRGSEVGQGTIQWEWDWVPGAIQYEVSVDGIVVGLTPDQQHYSQNLWVGDHSLSVKSINADWQYSERSETAKIYVQENYAANQNVAPPAPQNDGQNAAQAETQNVGPDNGLIDPRSWANNEVYQKEGYELAFSDEFNGSNINTVRWNTQLRWDGEFNGERFEYRVINDEAQFYVNPFSLDQDHKNLLNSVYNPFQFNGSTLAIRTQLNPLKTRSDRAGHGPLRDMVARQSFLSGALSTYDKFYRKYGIFEARMKIPSHVGTFPAFWLYHQKRKWEGTQRSEIDIMENLGHAPWYVYNTFHYHTNVSSNYQGDANFLRPYPQGQIYNGTDFSQDFHVYAVKWEPGKITWMIDGKTVSELQHGAVDYEELYININMAMGGNWANYAENAGGLGRPDNERYPAWYDVDPANFQNPALEIDYVRVYKRK